MKLIRAGNETSNRSSEDPGAAAVPVPAFNESQRQLNNINNIDAGAASEAAVAVAAGTATATKTTEAAVETPNFCYYCRTISDLTIALQLASVLFICVSAYFSMILTDWGTVRSSTYGFLNIKEGVASMWLQASAQWIAMLLYIWSLLAPFVCPGRDFN